MVALAFSWPMRGRCAEGRLWAERVAAVVLDPSPGLGWALAFLALYSGDFESGIGLAEWAVEQAAVAGNPAVQGRATMLLGMAGRGCAAGPDRRGRVGSGRGPATACLHPPAPLRSRRSLRRPGFRDAGLGAAGT